MKQLLVAVLAVACAFGAQAKEFWLNFEGKDGPGKGKKIVLISGDEEYRSEETMPMLAKILSHRHGFDCTVLFSWSRKGDYIDPNNPNGVRGWELLKEADLLIVGTRMRRPKPEDAAHMTDYLNAGKPLIGYRTSTHAFQGKEEKFGEGEGEIIFKDWGRRIMGEQWVNHHGRHKGQGCRGVIEVGQEKHAILNSVKDIFGPSDVYGVKHLTDQDTILLRGEVTKSLDPKSGASTSKKNNPMMPIAWLHPYTAPDGNTTGTAFCTTMGASVDFLSEDLRRLVVNASYHLLSLDVLDKADVTYVDAFYPSFYGFWNKGDAAQEWKRRGMQAEDFGLGKTPSFVDPPGTPAWPFKPTKPE